MGAKQLVDLLSDRIEKPGGGGTTKTKKRRERLKRARKSMRTPSQESSFETEEQEEGGYMTAEVRRGRGKLWMGMAMGLGA